MYNTCMHVLLVHQIVNHIILHTSNVLVSYSMLPCRCPVLDTVCRRFCNNNYFHLCNMSSDVSSVYRIMSVHIHIKV